MSYSFDELAEKFIEDYRNGLEPSVDVLAEKHPEFATDIKELFPALLLLEKGGKKETLANFSGGNGTGKKTPFPEKINEYRILRELGRGGMGIVYEAFDESLDRLVALKILRTFHGEEEQAIQRFHREAKMAAAMHHTNIVPVYDSGVFEDQFYYVMQYIDGISIEQLLSKYIVEKFAVRNGEAPDYEVSRLNETNTSFFHKDSTSEILDPDVKTYSNPSLHRKVNIVALLTELNNDKPFDLQSFSDWCQIVCQVGIQVCQALGYAHRHHVLHRDIKPSNLLIDEQGIIWITDFGLAKPMGEKDLTQTGQLVGTLRYMSPEGLDGEYCTQSDIYSLGLTLYEMLTLTPAFDETNYSRLLGQVSESAITPPRRINTKIPRDLETIVMKATSHEAENRYRSAAEFADDLKRFTEERPILARRVSSAELLWRWGRRNRLTASLLCLSMLLAFLLTLGVSTAYWRAQILLSEKEFETRRAKTNLNLAISAFDDIFSNYQHQGGNLDPSREEDAFSPSSTLDTPLSEKDIHVLESLMKFYDRFAAENSTDQKLIMETAIAHIRIGRIQMQIGRMDDAQKSIERAILFFRTGLDLSENPGRDIIRMATALNGYLRELDSSQVRQPFYSNLVNEMIQSLSDVSDFPEFQPQLDLELACLYRYRIVTRMNAIIRVEFTVRNYDGVHIDVKDIFASAVKSAANELALVNFDLRQSRRLLEKVQREHPEEKTYLTDFCWHDCLLALYQMIVGDNNASFESQDRALLEIERLIQEHPRDSRYKTLYIRMLHMSVFTARGDLERGPIRQDRYLERAIATAAELYRSNPHSISCASTLILAEYIAATNFHGRREYQKAEKCYTAAIEKMNVLERSFSIVPAARLYVPLHCNYANFLMETNRKNEARVQLELIAQYFQNQSKSPANEPNWRARVDRLKGSL